MKRICYLFSTLCVIALLAGMLAMPALGASASAYIALSSSSVTVGNTVKVTVTYKADADIGAWNYKLHYDKEYLEYVSGADSGGGGVLNFCNYSESEGQRSISQTATFRALKPGSANVSVVTEQIVENENPSAMSASNASATITVNAKPQASTDATLSALKVSPGTLSPEFSSSVTEYSVTVAYDVTDIAVSASVNDSDASKWISSTELSEGSNKISVVVTAESGAKKTYVINVTRQASELANHTVTMAGITYTVEYDTSRITPPQEGMTQTSVDFDGKSFPAFKTADGRFTLVCLTNGDDTVWAIYPTQGGQLERYTTLTSQSNTYVILSIPRDMAVPSGYERATKVIMNTAVEAFVRINGATTTAAPSSSVSDVTGSTTAGSTTVANSTVTQAQESSEPQDSGELVPQILVYAVAVGAQPRLYVFDEDEQTLSKYYGTVSLEAVVTVPDEEQTTESYESVLARADMYESNLKASRIILIITAALFVAFITVASVAMAVTLKKRKTAAQPENTANTDYSHYNL